MNQEERERFPSRASRETEAQARREARERIEQVKRALSALFGGTASHRRGMALEDVLNRLFGAYGLSILRIFPSSPAHRRRVVEQIDGAIELDGHLYLVEMKPAGLTAWRWRNGSFPRPRSSRDGARGLIHISNPSHTAAAIQQHPADALRQRVVVMMTLHEIVTGLPPPLVIYATC